AGELAVREPAPRPRHGGEGLLDDDLLLLVERPRLGHGRPGDDAGRAVASARGGADGGLEAARERGRVAAVVADDVGGAAVAVGLAATHGVAEVAEDGGVAAALLVGVAHDGAELLAAALGDDGAALGGEALAAVVDEELLDPRIGVGEEHR